MIARRRRTIAFAAAHQPKAIALSYALSFTATDPAALWPEAADAAAALVAGEPDAIANMANVAALIWQAVPDLNWAGFYRFDGTELVLGPFQGKAACIRIPLDKGVCGAAAQPQRVGGSDRRRRPPDRRARPRQPLARALHRRRSGGRRSADRPHRRRARGIKLRQNGTRFARLTDSRKSADFANRLLTKPLPPRAIPLEQGV